MKYFSLFLVLFVFSLKYFAIITFCVKGLCMIPSSQKHFFLILFLSFAGLVPGYASSFDDNRSEEPSIGSLLNTRKTDGNYLFKKLEIKNIFETEYGSVYFTFSFTRASSSPLTERPTKKPRLLQTETSVGFSPHKYTFSSTVSYADDLRLPVIFDEFSFYLKQCLLEETYWNFHNLEALEVKSREFLALPSVLQKQFAQDEPDQASEIAQYLLKQPVKELEAKQALWKKVARTEYNLEKTFHLTRGNLKLGLQGEIWPQTPEPKQELLTQPLLSPSPSPQHQEEDFIPLTQIDWQAPIPPQIQASAPDKQTIPLSWKEFEENLTHHVRTIINQLIPDP